MGLTAIEEELLWRITSAGEVPLRVLARDLGLSHTALQAVVEQLVHDGLVTRTPGEEDVGPRLRSLPLDLTLGARVRRQQSELDQARDALIRLADMHGAAAAARGAGLVTVLHGGPAIREQLRQIQREVSEEMKWLCRPGSLAMPPSENSEELDALARGVRYRVVYDRRLLEERGMLASLEDGIAAGESARSAEAVPVRLAIADRKVALCPLVTDDHGISEPRAAIVHSSTLLDALIALFEQVWDRAVPLHGVTSDSESTEVATPLPALPTPFPLSKADQRLLSLVAAGLPDKAIATHEGVSIRTVRRRVSALMQRTDCHTRIELVWQSARRGWI